MLPPHDAEPDAAVIDAAADAVDKRHRWRRAEDWKRNVVIIGLVGFLFAGGVAWGTAMSVVHEKVDREEFVKHVSESERRFLADSLRAVYQADAVKRIEATVNETNTRLSRFICDKQPAYCQ